VRPELTASIDFLRVNLMDSAWPIPPGLDAIFCRNVMIYFDKPTQRKLVERYASLLRPGASSSPAMPRASSTRDAISGCAARPSTSSPRCRAAPRGKHVRRRRGKQK
jgi:hypothetical protein